MILKIETRQAFDILQRMHGHQHKTRSLFRRLELATHHSAVGP